MRRKARVKAKAREKASPGAKTEVKGAAKARGKNRQGETIIIWILLRLTLMTTCDMHASAAVRLFSLKQLSILLSKAQWIMIL